MGLTRDIDGNDDPLSADNFCWSVHSAGYRWEWQAFGATETTADDSHEGYVLVTNDGGGSTEYRPATVPGLFRIFGETLISPESMLGFAARFGGIGVRVWTWSKGVKDRSANGSREPYRLVPGEDQENWQDEILSMRAAVRIWDAVTARRFKSVRLHFATPVYVGGPLGGRPVPTTIRDIPQESIIGVGEADDDLPEHFFWTKYMPPYRAPIPGPTIESKEDGWRLLVRMANHRLREHCSPVLVERGAEVDSLALRLSPKNLIGAMWWQFSRTLIGEASYRRCKVCSRLIELSGDYGFRADRELCSSACKFKDHRRKVKEAKRMRERRKTVAQIAKHFDTTTDTIKNWLTKKK